MVFVGRWEGKRDRAQKHPHHRENTNLGTTGRRATDGQRLEANESGGQVIDRVADLKLQALDDEELAPFTVRNETKMNSMETGENRIRIFTS